MRLRMPRALYEELSARAYQLQLCMGSTMTAPELWRRALRRRRREIESGREIPPYQGDWTDTESYVFDDVPVSLCEGLTARQLCDTIAWALDTSESPVARIHTESVFYVEGGDESVLVHLAQRFLNRKP